MDYIRQRQQQAPFPLSFKEQEEMQNPPPLSSSSSFSATTATALADSKTILSIILTASIFSLIFFLSISSSSLSSSTFSSSFLFHPSSFPLSPPSKPDPFLFPTRQPHRPSSSSSSDPTPTPPSIAYLISGSHGDSARILRLLFAVYHPKNQYLLHLDRFAVQADRESLALAVQSVSVFKASRNVNVIGKPDVVYPTSSSSISSRLHAASILLLLSPNWDWFISLNADDYPLVTQDDLLHILSYLSKDLNFVDHSSYIGWREGRKLRPVVVDPGLYLSEKSSMFYATQKRDMPNSFQLFTGSSFSILSRDVMEFCILATDNLPRTLLMYFSNTASALLNYFPTVVCNSRQFNRTVINDNLLYSTFQKLPKDEPQFLGSSDIDLMIKSGAAFATRFKPEDPVLDYIDREILNRDSGNNAVPGGWCLGEPGRNDTCLVWGDADVLRPGLGARRLEKRIVSLLSNGAFRSRQCIVE